MAPNDPRKGFRIEIDPEKLEEGLEALRARLDALRARAEGGVEQARHTKVRVSRNGRQIGPDLPLHLLLAGEGVALLALGPLWTILANLGARVALDVRLVHASDTLVEEGRRHWAEGEAEAAERCYRDAIARRPGDPAAYYQLGLLLRVTGRTDEARVALHRAAGGPEGHPDVTKAAELLSRMARGTES